MLKDSAWVAQADVAAQTSFHAACYRARLFSEGTLLRYLMKVSARATRNDKDCASQCPTVWAAMACQSGSAFVLGGVRSPRVQMQIRVPHSAPGSALVFVIAIEFAMRGLHDKWRREGLG